ncbi:28S ribosomal protein S5, mitochondrial [Myotis brandtii]|uniref:28S ribosomal protein S5, mitochondrial n=1 Tax=Myotis brandtii TaxID=109478 RepID=S7PKB6_MYOBR|nr:28S ribosomal protein S5, mitochondrial [Myotis brandtii]
MDVNTCNKPQHTICTQKGWPNANAFLACYFHNMLTGMEDGCAKVSGSLTCSPHLGLFHELSHQETHHQLAGKSVCVAKSKGSAALCPAWPFAEGALRKDPGPE